MTGGKSTGVIEYECKSCGQTFERSMGIGNEREGYQYERFCVWCQSSQNCIVRSLRTGTEQ